MVRSQSSSLMTPSTNHKRGTIKSKEKRSGVVQSSCGLLKEPAAPQDYEEAFTPTGQSASRQLPAAQGQTANEKGIIGKEGLPRQSKQKDHTCNHPDTQHVKISPLSLGSTDQSEDFQMITASRASRSSSNHHQTVHVGSSQLGGAVQDFDDFLSGLEVDTLDALLVKAAATETGSGCTPAEAEAAVPVGHSPSVAPVVNMTVATSMSKVLCAKDSSIAKDPLSRHLAPRRESEHHIVLEVMEEGPDEVVLRLLNEYKVLVLKCASVRCCV